MCEQLEAGGALAQVPWGRVVMSWDSAPNSQNTSISAPVKRPMRVIGPMKSALAHSIFTIRTFCRELTRITRERQNGALR